MPSSLLTSRQVEDLHFALLSYFGTANFPKTREAFLQELPQEYRNNPGDKDEYADLVERKWSSVIRLQKKVMDLEDRIASLHEELENLPQHARSKRIDASSWLPNAPVSATIKGHRNAVNAIAIHPIYTLVASASDDITIRITDFDSGECEKVLRGHTKAINDVDYSPDGLLLASASSDMTVKLWSAVGETRNVMTIYGHDHVVSSVRFTRPDGRTIATGSRDATLRVWNVENGQCLLAIPASEDWVRCVASIGSVYYGAGSDHIARAFDAKSECIAEMRGHDHVIECLAVAPTASYQFLSDIGDFPDLKNAKSDGRCLATGSRDKTIKLWNLPMGILMATLNGHDNWVRALEFHPYGQFLLSASDDKSIKCWDLGQGGNCIRTISTAHSHFITCLRWAPIPVESTEAEGHKVNGHTNDPVQLVIASGGTDQVVKIWRP